jgi:hypothetical protein
LYPSHPLRIGESGMARHQSAAKLLSGGALLCLALAGCNREPEQPVTGAPVAALPLAAVAPPPARYAPSASALPPAPRPIAYRPAPDHYGYLTDAYEMSEAFGDTPPDYTVYYDDEYPWIWRADDGAYRVVEWLPGGARYYYYQPGATEPFLIEDPVYAYAYERGALVSVYTRGGTPMPDRLAAERAYDASRYYARASSLYRAAIHQQRRAAYAAEWRQRAPLIVAQRERWQRARTELPQWRDWTRAHRRQESQRWAPERQRRLAYATALREHGIIEPPPPRARPHTAEPRVHPPQPQVPIARPAAAPRKLHPAQPGAAEHPARDHALPVQAAEHARAIQQREPVRKTAVADERGETRAYQPRHEPPRPPAAGKGAPERSRAQGRPPEVTREIAAPRRAQTAIERSRHFARPERPEPRRAETRPSVTRENRTPTPPPPARAPQHMQIHDAPPRKQPPRAEMPRPAANPHPERPAENRHPQRSDRNHN